MRRLFFVIAFFLVSSIVFAESAREYFKFAKYSYDTQDYRKALEFINQAIDVDPTYINGLLLRAQINYNLSEYNAVIRDINTAFDLYKTDDNSMSDFHLLRGNAYLKLNKTRNAINDIENSIEGNPGNAEAHFALGMINFHRKIYFEALDSFDKAIQLDSDVSEYYYQRAKLKKIHFEPLPETKTYESIMTDLKLASALTPNDYRVYILRVTMLKRDQHYSKQDLISELDSYIEQFPEIPQFYSERGLARVLTNEFTTAISDFTRAINLDKNNEIHYRNRGLCFHNINKYQLAMNDYSKSIDILANKYKAKSDDPVLKKALAQSFNMRGLSNQFNGNPDLACDDYYNAAKLGSKAGLNNYRKTCHVYN